MEAGGGSDDWRSVFGQIRNQRKGDLVTKISQAEERIYAQAINQDDYNNRVFGLLQILDRLPQDLYQIEQGPYLTQQGADGFAGTSRTGRSVVPGTYPTQQARGLNLHGLGSLPGTAHYVPDPSQMQGGPGLPDIAAMRGTVFGGPAGEVSTNTYPTQQARGLNLHGLGSLPGTAHYVPDPSQMQGGPGLPDLAAIPGTVFGGPASEVSTDISAWEPFKYDLSKVMTAEWVKEQKRYLQQLMSGSKCELLDSTKFMFKMHYNDQCSLFQVWKTLIEVYGNQLMNLHDELVRPHIEISIGCSSDKTSAEDKQLYLEMFGEAQNLEENIFRHLAILRVTELVSLPKWLEVIYNFQQSVLFLIKDGKKKIAEMEAFLVKKNPRKRRYYNLRKRARE